MSNKFRQGDRVTVNSGKYKGKLLTIIKYNVKNSRFLIFKKNTIFKTVNFLYVHQSNITHFNIEQKKSSKILFKNSLISLKSRFYKNSGHIISCCK